MTHPKHDYKDYPKTVPEEDFWGQVRRTVNGKPVPEEQIKMIVDAILAGLALRPEDNCLDIACGNGYLSSYLFPHCQSLFGVDASPYLIGIAQRYFEIPPRFKFVVDDAAHFVRTEPAPDRFNKVLCYGSFAYFSDVEASETLKQLHSRFGSVRRIMIGNLPDRDRASNFYTTGQDFLADLDNHESQIGIWRSSTQFEALAESTGWAFEVTRMPESFYAAHYRFDAVLHRKS
jgi:cyclopropane fatty-acyl-phospholipid synthase-like methyltransferase